MNHWTRKRFLQATLVGTGGAIVAGSSRLFGQAPAVAGPGSPSNDIRIAVVGVNGQGNGHLKTYYKMPGTRLVAICDVDSAVLNKRTAEAEAAGAKVKTYRDYRKLLEARDVDAVVIATPNHWHSLMTIWALQAGKDVYVEKPLSHNIWEGRQAVEAAKKYSKNLVQAGTQNRSSKDIRLAIEAIRSGELGKLQYVRGLCYKLRESIGLTQGPTPVPASIDYDLWTGPADLVPPHRNGPRGGPVHYDWHWFWNYGGGDLSNQGIHQVDVGRWILGEDGLPPTVMTFGGRFGPPDDAETPNTEICVYGYEKAPLIFEVRGLPTKAGMKAMDAYRGSRVGVIAQCEGGYVQVSEAGNATIYDNAGKKIRAFAENGNELHRLNFVECLRSRKASDLNGQIENSHVSTSLCHMGNLSYLLGKEQSNAVIRDSLSSELVKETFARTIDHLKANQVDVTTQGMVMGPVLKMDGRKEKFVGPDADLAKQANAHRLAKREGRAPFRVPEIRATT